MASDTDVLEQNIENLKTTVRKSFARLYATLKARELKTLRQLDVIRKQCEDNKDLESHCIQNIKICYSNEATLLDYISNYGVIDFEKLNFDCNNFLQEDFISPNGDHTLEKEDIQQLGATQEAALKQITELEDCVCFVNVQTNQVSKNFHDMDTVVNTVTESNSVNEDSSKKDCEVPKEVEIVENTAEELSECECANLESKKINPTDDWLNSIKNQTETEPSQVTDVMEHSTITCS